MDLDKALDKALEALNDLYQSQPSESPVWDAASWNAAMEQAKSVLEEAGVIDSPEDIHSEMIHHGI